MEQQSPSTGGPPGVPQPVQVLQPDNNQPANAENSPSVIMHYGDLEVEVEAADVESHERAGWTR